MSNQTNNESHFVDVIPSFDLSEDELMKYVDNECLEYDAKDRLSFHKGFNAGIKYIKALKNSILGYNGCEKKM